MIPRRGGEDLHFAVGTPRSYFDFLPLFSGRSGGRLMFLLSLLLLSSRLSRLLSSVGLGLIAVSGLGLLLL